MANYGNYLKLDQETIKEVVVEALLVYGNVTVTDQGQEVQISALSTSQEPGSIEDQVNEDTCSLHGQLLCPVCFDLKPYDDSEIIRGDFDESEWDNILHGKVL